MSAALRIDDPDDEFGKSNLRRRKSSRQRINARIEAESRSGEIEEVDLRDISQFGCIIAAKAEWIRLGKFVTLSLGDARRIEAIVRWSRDGIAGLEFLRPIPFRDAEIISDYIDE